MDDAPVWSDLATFDGGPWRGTVDWLIGGIPCQPHSVAGQRQGVDDERDLWPDAARIIREVGPSVVFLENVPGIAGYYHERIGPELRGMGYATQEGLFSAVEVGAPHFRQRFFVLGYSHGESFGQPGRCGMERGLLPKAGRVEGVNGAHPSDDELADAERRPAERPGLEVGGTASGGEREARERLRTNAGNGDDSLADTDGVSREGPLWTEEWCGRFAEFETRRCGAAVPDAVSERCEGIRWPEQGQPEQGLFPPAPNDFHAWTRVLTEMPSLEPAFCRKADGVAWWLDASTARAHRLRVLGNGVVPLVAAHAFRTLAARAEV